jgi:hypothetical protein
MTDRVMVVFAFAVLVGFLGILIWEVPRVDLGGAILVTLALAGWDFFGPKA